VVTESPVPDFSLKREVRFMGMKPTNLFKAPTLSCERRPFFQSGQR